MKSYSFQLNDEEQQIIDAVSKNQKYRQQFQKPKEIYLNAAMEALKKLAKWYCSFNMDPNFSLQIWIAEVSYINTKIFRQVKMTWKGLKVVNLLKWIHQQQGGSDLLCWTTNELQVSIEFL